MHLNDLQDEVLEDDSQSIFAFTLHNMGLKLPTAAAVVLNSFEEIDPIISNDLKSKLQKFLNVGPFTLSTSITPKSDENNCLKWLDSQQHASVVYISFGSVISPPPNEMAALAEALEHKKVPFLWSLRDYARKHLPEGFVDRICTYGKIVSWAPQMQVLAHSSIGVFVTHCGWNSILESITYGVPMICRPFLEIKSQTVAWFRMHGELAYKLKVEYLIKVEQSVPWKLFCFMTKEKRSGKMFLGIKEKALDAAKPNGSSTRNFEALSQLLASMPKCSTHPRTS